MHLDTYIQKRYQISKYISPGPDRFTLTYFVLFSDHMGQSCSIGSFSNSRSSSSSTPSPTKEKKKKDKGKKKHQKYKFLMPLLIYWSRQIGNINNVTKEMVIL